MAVSGVYHPLRPIRRLKSLTSSYHTVEITAMPAAVRNSPAENGVSRKNEERGVYSISASAAAVPEIG